MDRTETVNGHGHDHLYDHDHVHDHVHGHDDGHGEDHDHVDVDMGGGERAAERLDETAFRCGGPPGGDGVWAAGR